MVLGSRKKKNDNILIMLDHGYRLASKGFRINEENPSLYFFILWTLFRVKLSTVKRKKKP